MAKIDSRFLNLDNAYHIPGKQLWATDLPFSGTISIDVKISSIDASLSAQAQDISTLELSANSLDDRATNLENLTSTHTTQINTIATNFIPISGTSRIYGDITPTSSAMINLGSSNNSWNDVYLRSISGGSLTTWINTTSGVLTGMPIVSGNVSVLAAKVNSLSSNVLSINSDLSGVHTDILDLSASDSDIRNTFVSLSGSELMYGNLAPANLHAYTIGTSGKPWKDVFIDGFGSVSNAISAANGNLSAVVSSIASGFVDRSSTQTISGDKTFITPVRFARPIVFATSGGGLEVKRPPFNDSYIHWNEYTDSYVIGVSSEWEKTIPYAEDVSASIGSTSAILNTTISGVNVSLISTSGTLQSQITSLSTSVSGLSSMMYAISADFMNDIAFLANWNVALSGNTTTLSSGLSALSATTLSNVSKINTLSSNIDIISGVILQISGDFYSDENILSAAIDAISAVVLENTSDIVDISANVASVTSSLSTSISGMSGDLYYRVNSLSANVGVLSASVLTLDDNIDTVSGDLQSTTLYFNNVLTTLGGKIDTVSAFVYPSTYALSSGVISLSAATQHVVRSSRLTMSYDDVSGSLGMMQNTYRAYQILINVDEEFTSGNPYVEIGISGDPTYIISTSGIVDFLTPGVSMLNGYSKFVTSAEVYATMYPTSSTRGKVDIEMFYTS